MSALGRVEIAFLGGVVAGIAALAVLGFFAIREQFVTGNDFAFIWVGPAAVVSGADPYDPQTWRATTERLGASGTRESVYDYPPWTALGLLPLGLLPLPVAAALWAYGGLALAVAGMLLVARAFLERVPAVAFPVGFMVVASQPAIVNFYDGEWSLVLVAALAMVSLGLSARCEAVAGAGVLLLLAKPNPFAIAFPALVRAGVARRSWRFVTIVVGGGSAALLLGFVVFPGWLGPYFALIQGTRLWNPKTTVLPNGLREVFGDVGLVLGVAALLVIVLLALAFDPRSDAYVPAWLAVAPLVTPYLHAYDQLVLLVPTTIAIGMLARRHRMVAYAFAAVAFADLVVVAALLHDRPALAIGRETQNAFVPAALGLLVLAALWRDRHGRAATPVPSD